MISKLIELFDELPIPSGDSEFSAEQARKNSLHRVGKDGSGHPCLLISIKNSSRNGITPNVLLKNIKVSYDMNCKIRENKKIHEGTFTIITFCGNDAKLYDSFLRFCDVILDSLEESSEWKDVTKLLDRCVKLFKDISKPQIKTVQGLWSELFFVSLSKNVAKTIDAWHTSPLDKWDFNFGKTKYEIKSSSNRKREHFFSQEQLRLVDDSDIFVISIFVEETGTGKSMEDLVNDIRKKLDKRPDLIEKVFSICYNTLGNSLDDSFKTKFDTQLAKSSILAYSSKSIPKIDNNNIPSEISEVKYKVRLDGITPSAVALEKV